MYVYCIYLMFFVNNVCAKLICAVSASSFYFFHQWSNHIGSGFKTVLFFYFTRIKIQPDVRKRHDYSVICRTRSGALVHCYFHSDITWLHKDLNSLPILIHIWMRWNCKSWLILVKCSWISTCINLHCVVVTQWNTYLRQMHNLPGFSTDYASSRCSSWLFDCLIFNTHVPDLYLWVCL